MRKPKLMTPLKMRKPKLMTPHKNEDINIT